MKALIYILLLISSLALAQNGFPGFPDGPAVSGEVTGIYVEVLAPDTVSWASLGQTFTYAPIVPLRVDGFLINATKDSIYVERETAVTNKSITFPIYKRTTKYVAMPSDASTLLHWIFPDTFDVMRGIGAETAGATFGDTLKKSNVDAGVNVPLLNGYDEFYFVRNLLWYNRVIVTQGHQGVIVDPYTGNLIVIGDTRLKRYRANGYNEAGTLLENYDASSDVQADEDHWGGGFIYGDSLYIPMYDTDNPSTDTSYVGVFGYKDSLHYVHKLTMKGIGSGDIGVPSADGMCRIGNKIYVISYRDGGGADSRNTIWIYDADTVGTVQDSLIVHPAWRSTAGDGLAQDIKYYNGKIWIFTDFTGKIQTYDLLGNGIAINDLNTGTSTNSKEGGDFYKDKGYYFRYESINDVIIYDPDPILHFTNMSSWTISAWINCQYPATTHSNNTSILSKVNFSPTRQWNLFHYGSDGKIAIGMTDLDGASSLVKSSGALSVNTWHLVSFGVDDGETFLKLDAETRQVDAVNILTGSFSDTTYHFSALPAFGTNSYYQGTRPGTDQWLGYISEVRVINKAISDAEHERLYNRGK